MSKFWSFILVILFITSLITLGFVVFQVYEEKKSLSEDLEYRTNIIWIVFQDDPWKDNS